MLCRICSACEDSFFFLWKDLQVSLWRLQEGASVLMKCGCFRCYHLQTPDQIRTNLVCRSFPGWLSRTLLEFLHKMSRRCLMLMRRIRVLLDALLMESLFAYHLVLLLVSDCEMSQTGADWIPSDLTTRSLIQLTVTILWALRPHSFQEHQRARRCVMLSALHVKTEPSL